MPTPFAASVVQSVISMAPSPSAGTSRTASRQASIGSGLKANLVIALELLDAALRSITAIEIPGINESVSMWLAGEIDDTEVLSYIAANGGRSLDWIRAAHARRTRPQIQDLARLRNREHIDRLEYFAAARGNGVVDGADFEAYDLLRLEPPALGNANQWMHKHALEADLVDKWSLGDERGNGSSVVDAISHCHGMDYT